MIPHYKTLPSALDTQAVELNPPLKQPTQDSYKKNCLNYPLTTPFINSVTPIFLNPLVNWIHVLSNRTMWGTGPMF